MLTSDTIAGIVFLAIGTVLVAAALIAFLRWTRRDRCDHWDDGFGAALVAILAALFAIPSLALPITGFSLVGWNGDYMAFHPVHGTVQQVASRQISNGKSGMSQRFVVTIGGQPYAIDDTRAALLQTGDDVSLNCVREFEWGSTNNGYACNWG